MQFDEYGNRKNPTLIMLFKTDLIEDFYRQYSFCKKLHIVVPHFYGSDSEISEIYEPEHAVREIVKIIKGIKKDKVMLMGYSLGGELAVKLVSENEDLFSKAVFLSSWVCTNEINTFRYANMATSLSGPFKAKAQFKEQAEYRGYDERQSRLLIKKMPKAGLEQSQAWHKNRVQLRDIKNYHNIRIPMLAVCGKKETADIKRSLKELEQTNINCKTIMLERVNNDYVSKYNDKLNSVLSDFLFDD